MASPPAPQTSKPRSSPHALPATHQAHVPKPMGDTLKGPICTISDGLYSGRSASPLAGAASGRLNRLCERGRGEAGRGCCGAQVALQLVDCTAASASTKQPWCHIAPTWKKAAGGGGERAAERRRRAAGRWHGVQARCCSACAPIVSLWLRWRGLAGSRGTAEAGLDWVGLWCAAAGTPASKQLCQGVVQIGPVRQLCKASKHSAWLLRPAGACKKAAGQLDATSQPLRSLPSDQRQQQRRPRHSCTRAAAGSAPRQQDGQAVALPQRRERQRWIAQPQAPEGGRRQVRRAHRRPMAARPLLTPRWNLSHASRQPRGPSPRLPQPMQPVFAALAPPRLPAQRGQVPRTQQEP